MKGRHLLLGLVVLLVLAGAGLFFWKVIWLNYPVAPGEKRQEWVLEAKVVCRAKGERVRVALTLPEHLESRMIATEAAALDYGFQYERTDAWRGVWTSKAREGVQRFYFRVRVPEEALAAWRFPAKGGAVQVANPGLTGMTLEAAQGLVAELDEKSYDDGSFLRLACQMLMNAESAQEVGVLRRFYQGRSPDDWLREALTDLAAMQGIQVRKAYGLQLADDLVSRPPVQLIEYRSGRQWILFAPENPEVATPPGIAVWSRGGVGLFEVEGGENSSLSFTTASERVATDIDTLSEGQPVLLALFNSLPLSERSVFLYIVLIPIGTLVVVLFRNIVGIDTLGTFMPVLLALAFLEIPIVLAILLLAIILAVALLFRFQLSRLHLLVVPRVAACVVVVTLLMLIFSAVGYRIGFTTTLQITLFPLIILAWTVERMSLLWEEEGARAALYQISGSVVVAASAYAVMRLDHLQHLLTYFPELLLVVLAAIILLGRYTGYRLSELIRFRSVDPSQV